MPETNLDPGVAKNLQPVLDIDSREPEPGVALCLSGGGYRAMLFHLGAIWRLNELGLMRGLARVSSVSGGSITAGMLGLAWKRLDFGASNTAANYEQLVVQPIRSLAGTTIDAGSIIKGIVFPWKTVADGVANAYRDHLFGKATLQDLPSDGEGPRFVINATNVQSKVLWRFSKPYMGDYRVGRIPNPTTELAVAVGASSAFPPVLSPVILKLNPADFEQDPKAVLKEKAFRSTVVLTDGGVYDNLGLETAWKRYKTILVSDGGGATSDEKEPSRNALQHTYRVLGLIDNQVRSLRKRQVVGSYQLKMRTGTYWGMRTDICDYQLPTALDCPAQKTLILADTKTRLASIDARLQERIINWGYAVCDAAIRTHVDQTAPAPTCFPYPNAGWPD